MKIHVHELAGCTPTPLAHYLKALAILRLVTEQGDATARGWWRNESFHLATQLDRNSLERFFLDKYQPTPLISPWNGGSGFFPKDNKDGIDQIANSQAPRLAPYREAIRNGQQMTTGLAQSPKDEEKQAILRNCRATWRGSLLEWLEAALVLDDSGDPAYPALLGTGGNDGRLDFTNNFMQRLAEVLDCRAAEAPATPAGEALLIAALFGGPAMGLVSRAVGQFLPGAAGGANSTVGFIGGALINPWDFILMLEGAIVFASAATRRMAVPSPSQASAPFAVYSSATGYASAADREKNRGEQWMPIWERAVSYRELASLIAEGRCQLRDRSTVQPLDVARAIARLGVARGITAFERYGYIERNGQSNLATPLGRWWVPRRPQPNQQLLEEVAPWCEKLRRAAADKNAPARVSRAARACEEAMLACCRNGADAHRWRELLIVLGHAEEQLARSPGFTSDKGLTPIGVARRGGLSPEWISAVNDRSPELRLALSLAGQHDTRDVRTSAGEFAILPDFRNPVRRHFLPLENAPKSAGPDWSPRQFRENVTRGASVVCHSHDLEQDAIALIRRRVIEAGQSGRSLLPLCPVNGTEASLTDIAAFLNGELLASRILELSRPLMAMNWTRFTEQAERFRSELGHPQADEERAAVGSLALFGVFRLCHHWASVPVPIRDRALGKTIAQVHVPVRLDPAIVQYLAAGDLRRATTLATARLAAAGLRPHYKVGVGAAQLARRIVAALAFPIGSPGAAMLAARLTRPSLSDVGAPL